MNRIMVALIIILLTTSAIASGERNYIIVKNSSGRTLYVGGSGPNNYSKIQDAINDASDGDTVFVYDDSSPYYENLVIDKSIKLIGENKETTIIDGMKKGSVVRIVHNNVVIKNFTIRNSSEGIWEAAGIFVDNSQSNVISDNVILANNWGIFLNRSNKNIISGNLILDGWGSIFLDRSNQNIISDNLITNEWGCPVGMGILLEESNFNKITRNNISYSEVGICILDRSKKNVISYNIVKESCDGIHICGGKENLIFYNDLINNERNGFFVNWIVLRVGVKPVFSFFNIWLRNYWDDWHSIAPRPIFGVVTVVLGYYIIPSIPWLNFDWMPRSSPQSH